MAQEVRAVYEDGRLRVLDPVTLSDGEHVQLTIRREQERTRAALGDLLAAPLLDTGDTLDEAALLGEIEAGLKGRPSVSEMIIRERWSGP